MRPDDLGTRADALSSAIRRGAQELEPDAARRAEKVARKVGERTALAGDHTVAALAGATGSGKSSLTNALADAEVVATGVRRPVTSTTSAIVWGEEPATAVLEWLGVQRVHHAQTGATGYRMNSGPLDGLVLLDLPDFDSREGAHHVEADRILDLADLLVWVTDPQKYADARMHDDYIRARAHHETVMVVVLNQADTLRAEDRPRVIADLQGLLERDGVRNVRVVATSTRTGEGLGELREVLAKVVAARVAARDRLRGDVVRSAEELSESVADSEIRLSSAHGGSLVRSLSRAAGVPTVLRAVEADHMRRARAETGWPVTRWVRAFTPDPLKRLRLAGVETKGREREFDVRGRTSLPAPTPAARSAVDLACREVADAASQGLPRRWTGAVMLAAVPPIEELSGRLDDAVRRTPIAPRRGWWWPIAGALQWLFFILAVVGLAWLAAYAVAGGFLQIPLSEPPMLQGWLPLPAALAIGGLLSGLILAWLSGVLARIGARRRRRAVSAELDQAITRVADDRVIGPVRSVLARHAATREDLARARSGREISQPNGT